MPIRSLHYPRFRHLCGVLAALGICWGTAIPVGAQEVGEPPTIVPVDESPGHPAFHRFWKKFQRAVDDRDAKFIQSVISKDIKLDFGGGGGRADFVSSWKPADKDGKLWVELGRIVRLGGTLEKGEAPPIVFSSPYAFASWPDKFDAFEYVFINGRNVRFRAEPNAEGAIIRGVSWEIMKLEGAEGGDWRVGDWARLKAHDGKIGFVHQDYVRSSIDFRIGFGEDGKGGFEMLFFIAGD